MARIKEVYFFRHNMKTEKSNILRDIVGRVWAFWGILAFIITFLIIFIPSMLTWLIPGRTGQAIFIGIARVWMNTWLFLIASPLKISGKKNFKKGKQYIVTFNHNSLMDVPLSCPYVPGPNKTIAKSSFTRIPLFGFYYMKGSVLVDRKSERSRKRSFDKMKEVLREGMHMLIYPEGTRNRSNEPLKKFHDGAFKLAEVTGHDIIPAVLFNTRKALPLHKKFFLWPTKLELRFLEEVKSEGKTAEELKEEVFELMKNTLILKITK